MLIVIIINGPYIVRLQLFSELRWIYHARHANLSEIKAAATGVVGCRELVPSGTIC